MYMAIKNENGESEYVRMPVLESALNFVDASLPPPTGVTGHVYVLIGAGPVDAGWNGASLNDWVKYDGLAWNSYTPQDGQYCDDKTADKLMRFDGSAWVEAGGGGVTTGIWGIADTSGTYTYYATDFDAMAAASSGDTIELFGNYNRVADTELVFKDGVTVQLNGYTWSKSAGTSRLIRFVTGSTQWILNGKLKGDDTITLYASGALCDVYGWGTTIENTNKEAIYGTGGLGSNFYGFTVIGGGTTRLLYQGSYFHCNVTCTGTGFTGENLRRIEHCRIRGINNHTLVNTLDEVNFSTIISDGGEAIRNGSITAYKSIFRSSVDDAVGVTSGTLVDCFCESLAGTTLLASFGTVKNCTIISVSGSAGLRSTFAALKVSHCNIENSAGPGIEAGANSEYINNVIKVTYNNAAGHAIIVLNGITAGNEPVITNTSVSVANTGASYLHATAATRVNYVNLTSFDKLAVVTPVNVNITQGVATVTDAQGNNL